MVHDVAAKHPEHSIVIIENGHVTGRKVGDGASHVAMEQVRNADAQPMDHLSYLTKTPDGKILKSSTMYIRGKGGKVVSSPTLLMLRSILPILLVLLLFVNVRIKCIF